MTKGLTFAIIISTTLAMLAGWLKCREIPRGYSGPAEALTVGTQRLEPAVLLLVADEERLFAKNGLDVKIRYYDTGLGAVTGLMTDGTDMAAGISEYVLVGKAFKKADIRAVGNIAKVDFAFIAGRKDRGIETASDLRGKRIGVTSGTVTEFYLGRFLQLHDINLADVTLVDYTSLEQMNVDILAGTIDAMISVPPYITQVQNRLGDQVSLWPAQSSQMLFSLLLSKAQWIEQHPVTIARFLKALYQAEEFIIKQPEAAKAIVKKQLRLADEDLTRAWLQNQFSLTFDQSLIAAMEDEARWMITNKLTDAKAIPDYLEYIYLDGLDAIKPKAVNVIRGRYER